MLQKLENLNEISEKLKEEEDKFKNQREEFDSQWRAQDHDEEDLAQRAGQIDNERNEF
jgi:hypothetical protein